MSNGHDGKNDDKGEKKVYQPPTLRTSVVHERKALACGKKIPSQASCVADRKLS